MPEGNLDEEKIELLESIRPELERVAVTDLPFAEDARCGLDYLDRAD